MPGSTRKISEEIRRIYQAQPENAEKAIEEFLRGEYENVSGGKRLVKLQELRDCFKNPENISAAGTAEIEEEVLTRVFSLVLGKKAEQLDLSSTEILERLAESLNTIFDNLNTLVEVINQNLYREYKGDETIRQFIGFHMAGEGQDKPLEDYLGQIKKSFLVALQGFKEASCVTFEKILTELDPENFTGKTGGGFKFGPLRKAEYYEIYEKRFEKVKKWFDSGRFIEDLSREFEKACEKNLTREGGRK